jgi:GntR family transcriptional regulator, transcriptional repressor for pyruvate dehydrogenase complex
MSPAGKEVPRVPGATSARRRISAELLAPIETGTAVQAVVEQIIDHIRAGRMAEGELLPGERQLAVAMGVSRRTIRDAIEILQDAGVVSVAPGPAGGTSIASIWIPDSLSDDAPFTSADEVFQVLEARRVIEPRVAQLAALRGSDEDFAIMSQTIELQSAHQHDRLKARQGNAIFHRQLWRASRNPYLESAMRSIYRRLSGAFIAALDQDESTDSAGVGIALHQETLEAIMSGRPNLVEVVMDRHLAYLERRCEVAFGRARIPDIPGFLAASPNWRAGAS